MATTATRIGLQIKPIHEESQKFGWMGHEVKDKVKDKVEKGSSPPPSPRLRPAGRPSPPEEDKEESEKPAPVSSKPNDFKLGLFVLSGLALLVAALFLFGASKVFEGKTIQETYVPETVEGLKPGAPVLLRGVTVGQVTRINFSWNVYHRSDPRYVVVEFQVSDKVALVPLGRAYDDRVRGEIAKGLRARVKTQGLAGATILSLEYVDNPAAYPPLQVPWTPHHAYIPSAPGQFSEIIASLDAISKSLKEVNFEKLGSQAQQDLVAVQETVTSLNQSLANITRSSEELQETIHKIKQYPAGAIFGQPPPPAKSVEKPKGHD